MISFNFCKGRSCLYSEGNQYPERLGKPQGHTAHLVMRQGLSPSSRTCLDRDPLLLAAFNQFMSCGLASAPVASLLLFRSHLILGVT